VFGNCIEHDFNLNACCAGPALDFDDYIIGVPRIPPELPQALSEFAVSYVVPQCLPRCIARVRLTFNAVEASGNHVPLLFDIDILQECDINPLNDEEITKSFDSLRIVKNHVFFGTLAEKAVEIFE